MEDVKSERGAKREKKKNNAPTAPPRTSNPANDLPAMPNKVLLPDERYDEYDEYDEYDDAETTEDHDAMVATDATNMTDALIRVC